MLIVLGGLPGTGKTTVARDLSRRIRATHLRIDTIEQALRSSGALRDDDIGAAGYLVGYALAEDLLRLGQVVIADSVNPLEITRAAWRAIAARAQVPVMEIEIIHSDIADHRRRVENRRPDVAGAPAMSWANVVGRKYEPWHGDRVVVDTSGRTVEQSVTEIVAALQRY